MKVESEDTSRLEAELIQVRKHSENNRKENQELYLQIISLRTSERALKDENRRLNNKLDQLSLHGTQERVNNVYQTSSISKFYDTGGPYFSKVFAKKLDDLAFSDNLIYKMLEHNKAT